MKDFKRLLIIDDDTDDKDLFIEAVKEFDGTIECIAVKNGRQALELLNNTQGKLPDFIFLDLRMPIYGGKKCLFEIKSSERFKHIPVIIYTTSKNVEESKELIEMGACHFMVKPRNADDIYYLISTVLEEEWNASQKT